MNRLLAALLLLIGLLPGSHFSAAQSPEKPSVDTVAAPLGAHDPAGPAGFALPLDTAARPSRLYHELFPGPRRLRGTIGRQPVTLELDSANGSFTGGFYYDRAGRWLEVRLDAAPGARTLALCETPAGDLTGHLRLPTKPAGQLKGSWENADGRHLYPFVLRETYAGAARYEQELWEMWRYGVRRGARYIPRDSAFFHQLYVRVSLPKNPAAEQRLRRALAAPFTPAAMPAYLDTLLGRKQQQADGYQFHGSTDVVYNGNYLFSVLRIATFQEGPGYVLHEWYNGATFDLRTGRRLGLADLLVSDYQKRLQELFRRSLKRVLAEQPAYGPVGGTAARLPVGGFILTPAGLVFLYDERDDESLARPGPEHADRTLEIEVTYAELLPLIRRAGPLAPVLQERGLQPKK